MRTGGKGGRRGRDQRRANDVRAWRVREGGTAGFRRVVPSNNFPSGSFLVSRSLESLRPVDAPLRLVPISASSRPAPARALPRRPPAPAMAATEFAPARFLQQGPSQDQHQEQDWRRKPALLILNQPVASIDLLQRLWAHTGYRLCADGGANRLYDTFDALDDADARRQEFVRRQTVIRAAVVFDQRQAFSSSKNPTHRHTLAFAYAPRLNLSLFSTSPPISPPQTFPDPS